VKLEKNDPRGSWVDCGRWSLLDPYRGGLRRPGEASHLVLRKAPPL